MNSEQQKSVLHRGSHLLIVAGPGTGKTHTLTHRIAALVKEIADNKQIIAITFTNKAADEMRTRLAKLINEDLSECIVCGTFHQFCLRLLKEYQVHTSLPDNFRVASPEEIQTCIKQSWPELTNKERKDRLNAISNWKSSVFTAEEPETVTEYNQLLAKEGFLDFDDVLLQAYYLLRNNKDVLDKVQSQYPTIFVDEYQDINGIQHALLKTLVGPNSHITAIGDPNQAIYGFRGSDVRFFHSFAEDFAGATVFYLSDNYRSSQNLLTASGQMIAQTASAHVPALTAQLYQEGRLTIYQAPTDKAEAEYVVHQTEKMVGGTSMFSHDSGRVHNFAECEMSFGDVAVLYRLNSQRHALIKAFDRMGIPYQVCAKANIEEDGLSDDVCPERTEDVDLDHERVSLMTLHASKGLEFPVVFIVGCEENLLPLDIAGLTSSKEEERRLLYVGMTRAKSLLYLCHSQKRMLFGQSHQSKPSEFLQDIEEELKSYDVAKQKPKRPAKKEDFQMTLF